MAGRASYDAPAPARDSSSAIQRALRILTVPSMLRQSANSLRSVGLLLAVALPSSAQSTPTTASFAPLDLPRGDDVRTAAGAPGPAYWQQRVDYEIEARLDVESKSVHGRARVTYHNHSPHALDHLWVALEQDAFADDSEGRVLDRASESYYDDGVTGGVTLHELSRDGVELDFARYGTALRIDFEEALAPGATYAFDVAWSFPLMTREAYRFGVEEVEDGTIFQVAQWFPAVLVYDDVHGWNNRPFFGTGEFYTDFGDYDVRLTVPSGYLVSATGTLQNEAEVLTATQRERLAAARESRDTVLVASPGDAADRGEGERTWHFAAEDVRTVAWTASDAFVWDAATTSTGVLCQSFYPREGERLWAESTDMLAWSIEHYSERWFPYPYPVATNVNGPEVGMEYPMIVFTGSRHEELDLFFTTTHEIGHNWFPMLVNTDERRHSWMDEGFNTFVNYYASIERYDETFFDELPDFEADPNTFAKQMRMPGQVPLNTAHDYMPEHLAGWLSYDKPAMGLLLLREVVLGPERFDDAFRAYIRRWAFKSPRPADFYRTMEDASGRDLAWFWRGWFEGTDLIDQSISRVRSRGGTCLVTIEHLQALPMPAHLRIRYADGTTEDRHVPVEAFARNPAFTLRWTDDRPIDRVDLDPDGRLPDVDRANNVGRP